MSTSYFINDFEETAVSGQDAFDLTGTGDTLLVTTAGSLVSMSGGDGINASGASEQVVLDGLAYSAFDYGALLQGGGSQLLVNGEAQGAYGVALFAGAESVNVGASGTIFGFADGLYAQGQGDIVTNDGHISGAAYGIFSNNTIVVTNDGTISTSGNINDEAAVTLADGVNSYLQNAGTISGPVAVYVEVGASATIANAGTISGGLTVTDSAKVDIENTGVWVAPYGLDMDSSAANTLSNSGRIHAPINMGTGSDTIMNSGTINGSIVFTGSSDSLTNSGEIHGKVTMGTGDTLINTGMIHGAVTLGNQDTLNTSGGEITGAVTAAQKDTFDFSGSFGHNTILNFLGTSAEHDTIHFASDDFANYSAVQSHMAQVGNNVVITLDAGDTIVLSHILLSHLVSADFTFG
jgi:hypothetical protein